MKHIEPLIPGVRDRLDIALGWIHRNEEKWRKATADAAEHALTTWDWPVIAPGFDRLLLKG